jgi:predicted ester cyclase
MTGTHRGGFLSIPPTGRDVSVDGLTILHFRDGLCVERWSQADMLGWLVQLGAIEPPGA